MTPEERERIGNLVLDEGLITEEEMSQALAEGGARNAALAGLLSKGHYPRRTQLVQWLAADYRRPDVPDLRRVELPASLGQLVPPALARRLQVLPLARFGSILVVARPDGAKASILELRKVSGLKVKVLGADEGQVAAAIEHLYGGGKTPIPAPGPPKPETTRREKPTADPAKYETVPIINIPNYRPTAAPAAEESFTELEEIIPALRVSRSEYDEVARTSFGLMYRAWDELFRDGKPVRASRVG